MRVRGEKRERERLEAVMSTETDAEIGMVRNASGQIKKNTTVRDSNKGVRLKFKPSRASTIAPLARQLEIAS